MGLAAWRLPGPPQDTPIFASRVGAQRLQVDYGGNGRAYELTALKARELGGRAYDVGIPITTVALNALNDLGVTSRDRQIKSACYALVHCAIETAIILDATAVSIPAFRRSAINTAEDILVTATFLVDVAELAASAGLIVVHENVLGPELLMKLGQELQGTGVHFLFDAGNLHEYEVNWREYLAIAAPYLYPDAHIKDHLRGTAGDVALGHGSVPLRNIVKALVRSRKVDCLTLETDHRDHCEKNVRADLTALAHLIDLQRSCE